MKKEFYRVKKLKDQNAVIEKCQVADTFKRRLIGLMGRKGLDSKEGLFFPHCKSVHTWGMRFSIDLIFVQKLNENNQCVVTSCHTRIKPWRLFPVFDKHAWGVLELSTGTIEEQKIEKGDWLCFD